LRGREHFTGTIGYVCLSAESTICLTRIFVRSFLIQFFDSPGAPGETSLNFLQRIYRSAKQPMSRRLRAAIEAMPHEHPRLGAVAIGSMNGHDFATMLERAIERSGKGREVKQIEGRAVDLTPQRRV
jgi:hypothetical protein